jgi:uncharacterized repeat protein (TIGR03803 family)
MQGKKLSVGLTVVFAMVVATLLMTGTRVAAQTETVLYDFTCCPLGPANQPYGGLISDAAGNLYGTTFQGGAYGHGAVFELSPIAGVGWSETVIYSFNEKPGQIDYGPESGLTLDAAGNLYGTKSTGGASGFGMVFKLIPSGGGTWTLKVLHSFIGTDGDYPEAGVIFDGVGNLYGTTHFGGAYGYGAVFELSPIAGGGWREKVLYSFRHVGHDGVNPDAGLVFDAAGNLYGTTRVGGTNLSKKCQSGCGTVFELSPVAGKGWRETVLHSFAENGTDGAFAYGGLIIDGAGNLYGATNAGGTGLCKTSVVVGCGTVFELSPVAGGGWTEAILYNFLKNGTDGVYPQTGTLLLAGGNLYGVTDKGGTNSVGTVYKLSPAVGGGWTETILHAFQNNGSDGLYPNGSLIMDSLGNLYGTTSSGGTSVQGGTVFEITP